MGLFDFLRKRNPRADRSLPVGANDGLLLDGQVQNLMANLDRFKTDIVYLEDASDPMLSEDAFFVPNLLQEFNLDHRLAMLHGDGKCHGWINIIYLREALCSFPRPVRNYRDLFNLLEHAGFHIKKIGYISYRSSRYG